MRNQAGNKVIKPHWVSGEDWEKKSYLERLKLLRNYAADNTRMSLLLEIREEIRYYDRVIRQIRELTG